VPAAPELNARKRFITEEEKAKIRAVAAVDHGGQGARIKGLHVKVFVELLFSYGWRRGELINLKVGNIDLVRGVLRIETSKSGEGREVGLTPDLKVLLFALVVGHSPEERLFPIKNPCYLWSRLCKKAGVPCGRLNGVIMHDARRTTARAKRSAGVSETVAAATLGWKPGSRMFARYGIVDTADTLEAQLAQERWERAQLGHSEQLDTLQLVEVKGLD
jgi:integrase